LHELTYTLTPREVIPGMGGSVVGIQIKVKLDPTVIIEPNSDLLIEVQLQINDQPTKYQFAQKVTYVPEPEAEDKLVTLEGMLWFTEEETEIEITSYKVNVYYIEPD